MKVLDGRYAWLEDEVLDPASGVEGGDQPLVAGQPDNVPAGAETNGHGNGSSKPVTAKVQ
jgi:hypothetical protein